MTQLLADFNVQQTLASGVIGGGAALMIAALIGLFRKPPQKQEGIDKVATQGAPPQKLNPMVALVLILVGLGLVVLGVIWRVNSGRE